ncbi:MAG: DNA recombination protein RmuC [Alistipes sp.]|jgi:DNA recombination protein RmuC|nr:DNA recombination protein RmuC [Alistipes sp.]
MTTLYILTGLAMCASIVFLVLWLRERTESMGARIALEHSEALRAEAARAQEALREDAARAQEALRVEFRNLANDILEEKSQKFKETNRESLDLLLKPFRENLKDFRTRVEEIYTEENRQQGSLKNELRNLLELNQRITRETSNLTSALKGSSKVQGDWGEMILERMLEASNLQKGVHYFVQENFKDAETGSNLRPDVTLTLPEGKRIVIDSKVSLTAYVGFSAAEDDAARAGFLREHVASMRRHINELHAKNYQGVVGDSPDFVIMFVPGEPAFLSALQADGGLWTEAYNKKVIVSSPTNLFALLKIVDDLWKRDNQSRHALEIARQGGALYDKFVGFVSSLEDVGRGLERAQKSYDQAYGQLRSGRGNLVVTSEKLRAMGVKAAKKLPAALVDDSTAPTEVEDGTEGHSEFTEQAASTGPVEVS